MSRLTVLGDCLLDRDVEGEPARLSAGAPTLVLDACGVRTRPGGAGLAAALAAGDGHDVTLVTGLADDEAGRELRDLLGRAGVEVVDLGLDGATCERLRFRAKGLSLVQQDRGERTTPAHLGSWSLEAAAAVVGADAVLVTCHGLGMGDLPDARQALRGTGAPVVWQPHRDGAAPVINTAVATLDERGLRRLVDGPSGDRLEDVAARADRLLCRWDVAGVAVTRGEQGALFTCGDGMPLVVPAPAAVAGRADGAGIRFASAVAAGLAAGARRPHAITAAVAAATDFVAAGGAAALDFGADPAPQASGSRSPQLGV